MPRRGGTRTTAFLRLPGYRRQGEIARVYLSVADVLPTFLDLAGIPQPDGHYRGRPVQPVMGRSWAAWMEGDSPHVYGPKDAAGTGPGSHSLRQGDWKITDVVGDGRWLLFDIAKDPGETRDLSDQYPERKAELLAAWEAYVKKVGLVVPAEPRRLP